MRVWVFQSGEPLPLDEGQYRPMRAINLCNKLVQAGHQVTLWSADYNHQEKRFRSKATAPIRVSDLFEMRLISSSGYKSNIGLGRIIDHALLAVNINKMLKSVTETPDVAFIGFPPIETAYVLTKWLEQKKVPILLDVKDQWPTIFVSALPGIIKPLGPILFWPYFYCAKQSMRRASALCAMADGFLDWALSFCGKTRSDNDRVFPLTTPIGQVSEPDFQKAGQWWDSIGVPNDTTTRIYFVGSFSTAFDFMPIREAARLALEQGRNLQFVLCGDGGTVNKVKEIMAGLSNVIFPGWVDRPKIEVLADRCIASIAPYNNTPDFMLSVPNKIIDSLSLGLPILSPLKGEVEKLIDSDSVGLKYESKPAAEGDSLSHAINKLIEDEHLQSSLSSNARTLYDSRFSFEKIYGDLVTHLEQLAA